MSKAKRQKNVEESLPLSRQFRISHIEPLSDTQRTVFRQYGIGNHLLIHGPAGTGKTFVPLFLALRDTLINQKYDRILIVRSARPSVDMGFMPGSMRDKLAMYEDPYIDAVNNICNDGRAYMRLKGEGIIEFTSTSYMRGKTFDNTVVILDEAQNCSGVELHTVATRIGENSRLIVLGDEVQMDYMKSEQSGFRTFIRVLSNMKSVSEVKFTTADVVRSGFAKEYLMALEKMKPKKEDYGIQHTEDNETSTTV